MHQYPHKKPTFLYDRKDTQHNCPYKYKPEWDAWRDQINLLSIANVFH